MTTVKVFAPAKINLTLHITGRRTDGYHLIDSLVTFAPVSDCLSIQDGNTLSLTVEGPEREGVPSDMSNLALRAAEMAAEGNGASLVLEKQLPVASGIGGGSADAAAALRGMLARNERLQGADWRVPSDEIRPFAANVLSLGADVPMCLTSQPCRARGIGEKIEYVTLPKLSALLVNPRIPVSTAEVFEALETPSSAPMPENLPEFCHSTDLVNWLLTQRNDLEAPAIATAPVIAEVLEVLRTATGCQLARMSGSGATCFGIFPDQAIAIAAGEAIRAAHPNWWIVGGFIGDQSKLAEPRIS